MCLHWNPDPTQFHSRSMVWISSAQCVCLRRPTIIPSSSPFLAPWMKCRIVYQAAYNLYETTSIRCTAQYLRSVPRSLQDTGKAQKALASHPPHPGRLCGSVIRGNTRSTIYIYIYIPLNGMIYGARWARFGWCSPVEEKRCLVGGGGDLYSVRIKFTKYMYIYIYAAWFRIRGEWRGAVCIRA